MTTANESSREISSARGLAGLLLIPLAGVGAGLVLGIGLLMAETPLESWQLAARYTARLAFPIFWLAFTASAWTRLAPGAGTRTLLRLRRRIGLAFAAAHTVHLGALTQATLLSGQAPDLATLVVGGGAFAMMFAMAATSSDAAQRALGRHWRTLHRVGAHWIWFVFAFSYGGRTFSPDGFSPGYAVFFAAALAALGLRVAAGLRTR